MYHSRILLQQMIPNKVIIPMCVCVQGMSQVVNSFGAQIYTVGSSLIFCQVSNT